MAREAAFVLTPVGPKEGRYDVLRVEGATSGEARSGTLKVVGEASSRSRATTKDIVQRHAAGLRRLADR